MKPGVLTIYLKGPEIPDGNSNGIRFSVRKFPETVSGAYYFNGISSGISWTNGTVLLFFKEMDLIEPYHLILGFEISVRGVGPFCISSRECCRLKPEFWLNRERSNFSEGIIFSRKNSPE